MPTKMSHKKATRKITGGRKTKSKIWDVYQTSSLVTKKVYSPKL